MADQMQDQSSSISIHAPREGGDPSLQPTNIVDAGISIHAPREGGDAESLKKLYDQIDFNPRPPRGGRHSF